MKTDPLERPDGMSDQDYIEQLVGFISSLKAPRRKVISYFGLVNFIEKNSKYLSDLELEMKVPEGYDLSDPKDVESLKNMTDKIADFKDKSMTNMLKFADKIIDYNASADKLRAELIDEGVDMDEEEAKHLKGSEGFSLEAFLRGEKQ